MILLAHPSKSSFNALGLALPETIRVSTWMGFVVGVGRGESRLAFGDIVHLSGWKNYRGGWIRNLSAMFDEPVGGESGGYCFAGPKGETIEGDRNDHLLFCRADDILWRWGRFDFRRGGLSAPARMEPLGQRVFIRRREWMAPDGLNVQAAFDNPVGEVVAVGNQTVDTNPGQSVLFDLRRGTRVQMASGERLVSIQEQDVWLRWRTGTKPEGRISFAPILPPGKTEHEPEAPVLTDADYYENCENAEERLRVLESFGHIATAEYKSAMEEWMDTDGKEFLR